jgi:hypothetical protein
MTLAELLPVLRGLAKNEKLRAIQVLAADIARGAVPRDTRFRQFQHGPACQRAKRDYDVGVEIDGMLGHARPRRPSVSCRPSFE